jgi:predicted dehydrogenase
VEVYGAAGGVQIEGEQVARWEVPARPAPAPDVEPAAGAGAGASPTGIGAVGHTRILADFAAALRDGCPPLVPGEEGRRSLARVLAIYEAARTGGVTRPG